MQSFGATLKWSFDECCQNLAEPDEVKKDGGGGLEGGDVGKGVLWQDQPGRALPQQQVINYLALTF